MTGQAGPLLEQIRSTAVAQASERITAARAEADAIRATARDRAQRTRTAAVAAHQRVSAATDARTRAETAARIGRDTFAARAAALDRIFAAAERMLPSLATHPGLPALLGATIREGLTYVPPETATVACAGVIAGTVRDALAGPGMERVAVRIDESIPIGVIVETGDGALKVDGTFSRRLARERPRLSTVLARRLLEDPK